MKYTIDTRVRYSEVGMDEHMTLDAVLKYFQDCAVFQSEDLGCGIEQLREHNLVWLWIPANVGREESYNIHTRRKMSCLGEQQLGADGYRETASYTSAGRIDVQIHSGTSFFHGVCAKKNCSVKGWTRGRTGEDHAGLPGF